ncbi:MAG: hypothetical protein EXR11_10895 [Rhodospirillaceae bacterium]|nr:hypothetical protein [Rhodospirillaceae bacterium]
MTKPDHDQPEDFNDGAAPAMASATVNFAQLGLNQVAYIRRAVINNVDVWSIHAATGDAIGAARTFEQAWGAVMQNNLAPVRVH